MSGQLTKEGSQAVPQQAFVQYNDPHGNKLSSINRDGSFSFTQTDDSGITIAAATTSAVPVVNGSINLQHINTEQTVHDVVNVDATVHLVGIYAASYLDGGGSSGDNTLTLTVTWTDTTGVSNSNQIGVIDGVDSAGQYASTGLFIVPAAGTSVGVISAYTSSGHFHYSLNVVIVQYPNIAQLV